MQKIKLLFGMALVLVTKNIKRFLGLGVQEPFFHLRRNLVMMESIFPEFSLVEHTFDHAALLILVKQGAFVHKSFDFLFVLFYCSKKVKFVIYFKFRRLSLLAL